MRNYVAGMGEKRIGLRFWGPWVNLPPWSHESPGVSLWISNRLIGDVLSEAESAQLLCSDPWQYPQPALLPQPLLLKMFLFSIEPRRMYRTERLIPVSNSPSLQRAEQESMGWNPQSQIPAWDLEFKSFSHWGLYLTYVASPVICP